MASNNLIQYGGDLMLFVATGATTVLPLAFSTTAKLDISMSTREISSKDSNDWTEKAAGKFTWNASSDALISYVATGSTQSTEELFTYMTKKCPISLAFATKTGISPSWTVSASFKKFTGSAYITSLSMNAPDGESATYSVSLEGNGALTLV